jgi:hypothetical protein
MTTTTLYTKQHHQLDTCMRIKRLSLSLSVSLAVCNAFGCGESKRKGKVEKGDRRDSRE